MVPRQKTSTTRLPKQLLDQLGLSNGPSIQLKSQKVLGRKERRRNERNEWKRLKQQHNGSSRSQSYAHSGGSAGNSDFDDAVQLERETPKPVVKPSKSEGKPKRATQETAQKSKKSILKKPKPEDVEADKKYVRKAIQDNLAEDDAEIERLEKKLGIKGKKLPKAFANDGLDWLLEGLDSIEEPRGLKRKRGRDPEPAANPEESDDTETGIDEIDGDDDEENSEDDGGGEDEDEDEDEDDDGSEGGDGASDESDGFGDWENKEFIGFDNELGNKKEKEWQKEVGKDGQPELDIYGRPKNGPSQVTPGGKYIPPSLRKPAAGEDEELIRLKRQIQGPINRLSEANMISIVAEMEQLYRSHPRHNVISTLTNIVLSTVCDRSTLLDTFMVLHAGFLAALYKVIGTDFGAHVIQRIVEEFDKSYNANKGNDINSVGKECTNLISILSELYNFQVIGSRLMFDLIRMFLKDITELNTELLLKVVRNCGTQLRSDDPTALRDIVLLMQASIAKIGEVNLSVRTKFMVESVTQLKNNRLKTATANTVVLSEAIHRMKKALGSLNTRHLRAHEPLRLSLDDIRNVETKGKWWLVGASWRDNMAGHETSTAKEAERTTKKKAVVDNDTLGESDMLGGTVDLLQLAREQRMNTDVRRAIFVTIMGSEDYKNACERLPKLRLKKAQEKEIPRVLLHCSGAEETYNPYYTLIARQLCAQHALKMTFQFSLWDLFRRMGEGGAGNEGHAEEDDEDGLPLRKIVNLAKLYGTLVAELALSLNILKVLNLAYLQSRTRAFLEIFFITVTLKSQPRYKVGERSEKAIMEIFLQTKDNPELTRGMLYFIKKHVRNSDIAGGAAERDVIKWGARVACDALKTAAVAQVIG
ncbi:hypothetical protein BDZ91DRAFT_721111 [Kalaharituber pfeilii]|nr:hypothetical protein BDZ91DRAFT_721111 [Kalaharituber pfeilii]